MSEKDKAYYKQNQAAILAKKRLEYRQMRSKQLIGDGDATIIHDIMQLIRGGVSSTELAIYLLERTTHGHRYAKNLPKITVPTIADLFAQSQIKVRYVRAKCRQILNPPKS
jgi:hypothetical protein